MTDPWKTEVAGTRHMVVAGHYLAAHAAFTVLEAGGNAMEYRQRVLTALGR